MSGRPDLPFGLSVPAGSPAVAGAAPHSMKAPATLPLGPVLVVGGRHNALARIAVTLAAGQELLLRREPANPFDRLAVAVHAAGGERLGYLPRQDARRVAALLDAGGEVVVVIAEGSPREVAPGEWRLEGALALRTGVAPQGHGLPAPEQLAPSSHAPVLLAEHRSAGARAVILAGPAAGWQRGHDAHWLPPGGLSLPNWETQAHLYRLRGGEAAAIATAQALLEAERLGLAPPGAAAGCTDDPAARGAAPKPGMADPLARKRRGHGQPLPARLRLVAQRLEAGLRETPQRFVPVAYHVARLQPSLRRRFLSFLLSMTLMEAALDPSCPAPVLLLLQRAAELMESGHLPHRARRRDALADDIRAAMPRRRRRRSIHCHGVVTADRRLLVLGGIICAEGCDPCLPERLRWTIAYAMADYDGDHFVMRGVRSARRVRALADWLEAAMAEAAGLLLLPLSGTDA